MLTGRAVSTYIIADALTEILEDSAVRTYYLQYGHFDTVPPNFRIADKPEITP
ncbi:MAG TPA: hypothetical protein VF214_08630 [Edaphobacter sp.]